MLLTGLGNGEHFCLEGGRCRVTLLLNHVTLKNNLKKIRFHHKTTSQSGMSAAGGSPCYVMLHKRHLDAHKAVSLHFDF